MGQDWREPAPGYFGASASAVSGADGVPGRKRHLTIAENALLRPAHPGSVLIFIEGGLAAWLVGRPLWDPANPTIGTAAGAAAFYLYTILYMVPYLNQTLSVMVSIPWAYFAGYLVETYLEDTNRVDLWGARVVVFLISAVAHWVLTDSPG